MFSTASLVTVVLLGYGRDGFAGHIHGRPLLKLLWQPGLKEFPADGQGPSQCKGVSPTSGMGWTRVIDCRAIIRKTQHPRLCRKQERCAM